MSRALGFVGFQRIVFLFTLLVVARSLAAEAPSEFVDIRWGASVADIKRAFTQRPGAKLTEEKPSRIVYQGGAFVEYPAERWELESGPKGFWQGTVFLTIPAGNAPDGKPLRNRQFDDLAKSLSKKYGKPTPVPSSSNAAEATWKFNDPSTGKKDVYTVFLRYSWAPSEFLVRYSYEPNGAQPAPATPPPVKGKGKRDL